MDKRAAFPSVIQLDPLKPAVSGFRNGRMGRPIQEAKMAKKQTAPAKNHPSHGVYVVEGEGDRAFWTRIGCAWLHQDGEGFNVSLSALPLSGRLVIRAKKEGQ